MPTVQTVIVTARFDDMLRFYTELFGAEQVSRVPDEGPVFFVGLRIGDSEIGLVSDTGVGSGPGGRILISVDVAGVDALLPRVEALGGTVSGPPNDMPWGQRVAHVQDPDGNSVNLAQPVR